MTIDKALQALKAFQGESLTKTLADIETQIEGLTIEQATNFSLSNGITDEFLDHAKSIKRIAGQINVIIHAAGILRSLGTILKSNEVVENVSLGAGNTGRKFDLETNLRIAEYKFIDWQGGSEAIRQNGIFKDFYSLAEYQTDKTKHLYVVGTEFPLKFFNGGRALSSVLSRYPSVLNDIHNKYGTGITKVRDYYALKKNDVIICDITPFIS